MNLSQKCLLAQYFRSRIFREKSAIDSLSRKTTVHGPRRTIQAGKQQVVSVADRSASGNDASEMGEEDYVKAPIMQ
jgi:hypothetical protein